MSTAVPVAAAPEAGAYSRMSFSGDAGAFFGLLVRGSLLQIPTFGFYRFWLITQLRRHLWANTRIGEEAFEYTGTAKEILIGFLTALAVLVPLALVYAIVSVAAANLVALASVLSFLLIYAFGYYAVFKSRRYRAARTSFRGIRFWMDGSGWAYAGRAFLWDLLTVVTIGLAAPWRSASLERYMMRHTYFGNLQGSFVGTGSRLFRRTFWFWGGPILLVVALVISSIVGDSGISLWHWLIVPAGLGLPVITLLYLAVQARWRLEGVRFGEVAVYSTLSQGVFLGAYFRLLLSSFGWSIGFGMISALYAFAFAEQLEVLENHGLADPLTIGVAVVGVFGYLVFLLGLGVLKRYFVDRGLWASMARSVSVANLAVLDGVVAAGQRSDGFGEGLADALDVGAL